VEEEDDDDDDDDDDEGGAMISPSVGLLVSGISAGLEEREIISDVTTNGACACVRVRVRACVCVSLTSSLLCSPSSRSYSTARFTACDFMAFTSLSDFWSAGETNARMAMCKY